MKKNKFEFIIDAEFQSQIPALTEEEFQQLEENILFEGEVLSPLIVWGNILVDGHNRYKILQQHPEIPYSTRSRDIQGFLPEFFENLTSHPSRIPLTLNVHSARCVSNTPE